MGKGALGVLMKVSGADDYQMTVTSVEKINEGYMRLGFTAERLLEEHPPHPTQWVRMWFPGDKPHQRAYTLLDQDVASGSFSLAFALPADGPASNWARGASVGDQIDATMLGSNFQLPTPLPKEFVVFGDAASLPAINTLLDAIGETPARVFLEWQEELEATLPVHAKPQHEVTWVQRLDGGRLLREQAESVTVSEGTFAWVASDWRTTRAITKTLKSVHGLPKTSIKAQAYWK